MLERPHTEFIHAQALPWRRIPPGGARADAEYKFLSRDPNDGACSCLIRYPAGWTRNAVECLTADEEFYVLEGEIIIDDTHYTPDTYAFLPAGWPHRHMHVPRGAVLLCFYSAQPNPAPLASDPNVIQRTRNARCRISMCCICRGIERLTTTNSLTLAFRAKTYVVIPTAVSVRFFR